MSTLSTMSTSALSLLGIGVIGVVGVAGLIWILVKKRSSIMDSVPLGYEDESGFHFGTPLNKQ